MDQLELDQVETCSHGLNLLDGLSEAFSEHAVVFG